MNETNKQKQLVDNRIVVTRGEGGGDEEGEGGHIYGDKRVLDFGW